MFKVGDKVICIDDKDYPAATVANPPELNKVYTVKGIHSSLSYLYLEEVGSFWLIKRFKLVEEVPPICTCNIWVEGCKCGLFAWEQKKKNV